GWAVEVGAAVVAVVRRGWRLDEPRSHMETGLWREELGARCLETLFGEPRVLLDHFRDVAVDPLALGERPAPPRELLAGHADLVAALHLVAPLRLFLRGRGLPLHGPLGALLSLAPAPGTAHPSHK